MLPDYTASFFKISIGPNYTVARSARNMHDDWPSLSSATVLGEAWGDGGWRNPRKHLELLSFDSNLNLKMPRGSKVIV